jgi:anti-sigma factor RsiW
MTAPDAHPGDELHLLLEDLLPPAQRAAVEAHVAGCERCRRELAALRWTRTAARAQGEGRGPDDAAALPPALAARITASLDAEDRAARRRRRVRWSLPVSLAAAAVLALVLLRPLLNPRGTDFVDLAARDYQTYRSGALALDLQTAEPARLAAYFAERLPAVPARVFDFGMMGYTLAGGRVHRVAGRDATLFAYRNAAGTDIVCVMYAGTLAELRGGAGAGGEERVHEGIRFRVYRSGALTLVFWEEGDIVCVLVSVGDPDAVVQFAYAKAVKAA